MTNQFFSGLNYTLANEDSGVEMSIVRPELDHVVSVAGSGARVLPLFASMPRSLTCVDLSEQQLLLTELRIESCRVLCFEDYLAFWGYPPANDDSRYRRELFSKLSLSDNCKRLFLSLFENGNWSSLLYGGKWERTFSKIAKICQSVLGDSVHELFHNDDFSQHLSYMKDCFPHYKWRFLVFLIGNSSFFNTLLYKGSFPKKNVAESHFKYYYDAYKRIFERFLPRDNFFLQLTLLGCLKYESGSPIECRRHVFEKIKEGICLSHVRFRVGNIVELVEHSVDSPVDFLSLSDVPSYFDEATAHRFLRRMSPGLADGADVVVRCYLRELVDTNTDGFDDVSEQFRALFASEMTQMYRMSVFRKKRCEMGGR